MLQCFMSLSMLNVQCLCANLVSYPHVGHCTDCCFASNSKTRHGTSQSISRKENKVKERPAEITNGCPEIVCLMPENFARHHNTARILCDLIATPETNSLQTSSSLFYDAFRKLQKIMTETCEIATYPRFCLQLKNENLSSVTKEFQPGQVTSFEDCLRAYRPCFMPNRSSCLSKRRWSMRSPTTVSFRFPVPRGMTHSANEPNKKPKRAASKFLYCCNQNVFRPPFF